ncbi:unnamed protein product [Adineta steineri]|uniref:F-box domain-containing protein n=1 Tax=Adineta steineri TaxID=433720 RepID=A0A814UPK3_9BILA|nr:unnamed protein product [Adineta steineri]
MWVVKYSSPALGSIIIIACIWYTCFESLSNEVLCEILENLDACDIYKSFSNLNNRLQTLITSSSFLLRIRLDPISKPLLEYHCQQVIIPNSRRIRSLYLWDPSTYPQLMDTFFNYCIIDSTFHRLESIFLHGTGRDKLLTTLVHLKSLPRLFTLTIFTNDKNYKNLDLGKIYQLIFSLPKLKYNRLCVPRYVLPIYIPHVINQQFSTIEYLVIDHFCTLDELNSILHYTPQLRRLSCHGVIESDEEFKEDLSLKLPHLKYIYFQNCDASFDEFEVFIKEISSQLQIFNINIYWNKDYLDSNRWEQLIKEYMPQLKKFYFHFNQYFYDDDRKINLSDSTDKFINQFSSLFWVERKLFRELRIDCEEMNFSIHSYRKEWIDRREHMNIDTYSKQSLIEDNCISNQEKTDHYYLDSNRWEQLIKEYMPQLKQFYFQFDQSFDDDDSETNSSVSSGRFINQFNSPFWVERKLFRELRIDCEEMSFSIYSYRKEWIDLHEHMNTDIYSKQSLIEDNCISNQEKTDHSIIQLIIQDAQYTELNWQFLNKLKSTFKAIQFTHLDIEYDSMCIHMLLDIISSLPNIESLKLSSLPIFSTESLPIEDTENYLSVLAINKITKVKLRQIIDEQELEFFINLCPHMQDLELECMSNTGVPSLMKLILMNRRIRIPDLYYLCFIIPMADENMVRTLAKIIDSETVNDNYTIQRSGNKMSVHWKL